MTRATQDGYQRPHGPHNVKENDTVSMDVSNSNRIARMTPAQFARDECANMLPDGACLGVTVGSLLDCGQPKTCTPRDCCLVVEGRRCDYFERVVLPLADHPSPSGDPGLQQKRAYARQEYLGRHGLAHGGLRRCPDCGSPMPARHRYCESCSARHRRETYRRTRAGRHEVCATVEA